jgi:acetyltransferase-like isoleucine patch superfamily enzyme
MGNLNKQIEASKATIADDVSIGSNSIIRGDDVILRQGVRIGDNVEVTCDTLDMGPGCTIDSNCTILCPRIALDEHCSIGTGLHAELNQYFQLGRFGHVSPGVNIIGQGVKSGEFLYVDRDVSIGGGGARGPRAFLTLGHRISLFAQSFINLSEPVSMGDDSAISYNVALITHYAWQTVLKGYAARFAPISISHHVAIYANTMIMPGVTVGEWVTIAAGSIVLKDLPAHCLVAGNPAKVIRGPEGYPAPLDRQQKDALLRTILADYLTNLEPKGVEVVNDSMASQGYAVVEFEGRQEVIRCIPSAADSSPANCAGGSSAQQATARPDVTLSAGPVPAELWGRCHFDLDQETMAGEPTTIAEDLRDYLRRRALRVFTDKPFRSLPLANLQRLQRRRKGQ